MKLTHPFVNKCPDINELFFADNEHGIVCTINSFCYKIKKLSAKYADRIDENCFKGDALELFTEYMIKSCPEDNRIGIYDYTPITDAEADDVGVDGFGIGDDGTQSTVQVKYRAGDYVLTANNDHLSNFLTSSWNDYNVPITSTTNMLIVTTGLKVDERTREKMLKGKVRVLARDDLRKMYDNRPEWWKRFYQSVTNSRIKKINKRKPFTLRCHQIEAKKAMQMDSNQKGKIILPTGTGKTLIESDYIRERIQDLQKQGVDVPVIKINSSRILLCFQLFDDVLKRLMGFDIDARYVNYNSGNKDDAEYAKMMKEEGWEFRKILSTTSYTEVKEIYKQCQIDKMPLIIFSTYHSAEKFAKSGIIPHVTIHDEAHNLVSSNFHRSATLPSNSNFFFTATEKITDSDEDIGMNNETIFDNLVFSKSAYELIHKGEMVPPYLHIVRSSNEQRVDTDYELMLESVVEAFEFHEKKIKELSYSADDIGAKILVVCRGQQDLQEMFKTKALEKLRASRPDIHLFALSSDFGICLDGAFIKPPVTNIKKYELLKMMKSLSNNDKALIFHVDMIGEGIDVPGITGIMPFRNCEESKLIQNIGRSTRLHLEDRRRLYAGEINPDDKSKWIKPYSWVIIPSYMIDADGLEGRFSFIIERLRSEYGYIPQQNTVIDNVRGLDDDDEIDTVNDLVKMKKWNKSGVEDFSHEFEKISAIERLIQNEIVYKKKEAILASILSNKMPIEASDEPVEASDEPISDEPVEAVKIPPKVYIVDVAQSKPNDVLFCKSRSGGDATGRKVDNEFVVFKGSKFRKTETNSIPSKIHKIRKDLVKKGALVEEKDYLLLIEDFSFNSGSQASSCVLGKSSNGNVDWKKSV